MDKKLACHEIALVAAKIFVDSNMPGYKITGYESMVETLTNRYIAAFKQVATILDKESDLDSDFTAQVL